MYVAKKAAGSESNLWQQRRKAWHQRGVSSLLSWHGVNGGEASIGVINGMAAEKRRKYDSGSSGVA